MRYSSPSSPQSGVSTSKYVEPFRILGVTRPGLLDVPFVLILLLAEAGVAAMSPIKAMLINVYQNATFRCPRRYM
jgi:hypothetical protein